MKTASQQYATRCLTAEIPRKSFSENIGLSGRASEAGLQEIEIAALISRHFIGSGAFDSL
jgi:hypothetical protein